MKIKLHQLKVEGMYAIDVETVETAESIQDQYMNS